MSLDFTLEAYQPVTVFEQNITHNLNAMARAAGIYEALWRPERLGAKKASDLVPFLQIGIKDLEYRPDYFKKFNPANGWGDYENLLSFSKAALQACKDNPEATIKVYA